MQDKVDALFETKQLPRIPVLDVAGDWPVETVRCELERTHNLIDAAAANYPRPILKRLDALSRRWLKKWHNPHLGEIDAVAALLQRPGAHFLNVSYEWGCTSRVGPSPSGDMARLVRVLDWPYEGLGRYAIAARITSKAGPWLTVTWPGYTGVLQGVAKGRFAAALNQAPMEMPSRIQPLDWLINRMRVWRSGDITPAHLLRRAFETCKTYDEARTMLCETRLVLPTIFTLAGIHPDEGCVIERRGGEAHIMESPASAANDWQKPGWSGRVRGTSNTARVEQMSCALISMDPSLNWLRPPILNDRTRLVFLADAKSGRMAAAGIERETQATQVLRLTAQS